MIALGIVILVIIAVGIYLAGPYARQKATDDFLSGEFGKVTEPRPGW